MTAITLYYPNGETESIYGIKIMHIDGNRLRYMHEGKTYITTVPYLLVYKTPEKTERKAKNVRRAKQQTLDY